MTASEKKFVERNLDLIFEFEKYVLEHPAIAEKIPRDAVVFMKVIGDQSLIVGVSARRKAGEKRRAAYLNHGEKNGTRSFSHRRARARARCLNAATRASLRATGP
jgi:hypothetical protein